MRFTENLPPQVVKNLLVLNVLMYIVFNILFPKEKEMLALHYWGASDFRPLQIITFMFIHTGFWQLAFNMLVLWIFGSQLENYWGSRRFIFYYMACGLGSAIFFYTLISYHLQANEALLNQVFKSSSKDIYQAMSTSLSSDLTEASLIGSSGAILGILIAYALMFPNNIVSLKLPLKAKYLFVFLVLIELIVAIVNNPLFGFAHLGGLIVGLAILIIWRARGELYK